MSKRILIVEDDELLNSAYRSFFRNINYTTKQLYNGRDVVSEAIKFGPDLVLLDVLLPNKDGIEILKELKSNTETKTVPVLMTSNVSSAEVKQKAKEAGAEGYFIKSNTLLTEIKEAIDKLT